MRRVSSNNIKMLCVLDHIYRGTNARVGNRNIGNKQVRDRYLGKDESGK